MSTHPVPYAGIVSRGIAFAIDAMVVVVATTIATVVLQVTGDVLGADLRSSGGGAVALAYLLSVPLVFGLYCTLFWSLVGRTPGMRLLGLRVTGMGGGRVRVGQAVVRVLGYSLSLVLLVGFGWIAVDRRRQGFHDKLARTFVVYDDPRPRSRASTAPTEG